MFRRIFLVLVVSGSLGWAISLDALMAQYKRAPESQRYAIMNRIKMKIAQMNQKRQRAAIRRLRTVTARVARKDARRKTVRKHHKRRPSTRRNKRRTLPNRPSPLDVLQHGFRDGSGFSGGRFRNTVRNASDSVHDHTSSDHTPSSPSIPDTSDHMPSPSDMMPNPSNFVKGF
jgi:hypothetical protein